MERFNALGRGMQLMLVAGVLLLIDMFLRWQEVSADLGPLGEISAGVNAWHGFWGVVMGLLTIVLVAWLVARIAAIDIPLPISATLLSAALAAVIFIFALIKNLADAESTIWAYIGVILAAAIVVGAWLQVQATGGMESLKSEIPSRPASSSSEPPAAAAPAPPAAPEAAPSEPPASDEPSTEREA